MPQVGGLVDVMQRGQFGVPQAGAGDALARVGHHGRVAPAHPFEQARRGAPQPHQHVAAIGCRPEHGVVRLQGPSRLPQVSGVERRGVGADQQRGGRRRQVALKGTGHARPKVTVTLVGQAQPRLGGQSLEVGMLLVGRDAQVHRPQARRQGLLHRVLQQAPG